MAVNNSTIKKIFSWVDFYEELANELLKFKDNRKHLLEILNKLDHKRVSYLRDKKTDEWKFPDIEAGRPCRQRHPLRIPTNGCTARGYCWRSRRPDLPYIPYG